MLTLTSMSPLPYPLNLGMPLPLSLMISRGCVPGRTFMLVFPSSGGIETSVPSAAWGKPIVKL